MRFLNRHPGRSGQWLLTLLPFLILALLYAFGSATRLADNPNDKLLPSLAQMVDAVRHMAFMEDPRTGDYLFWSDTLASLQRVLLGLGIAAVAGLAMGIANGIFPVLRAGFSPLLTVISMVPPLAILPILFIVMGLDELSKVMLIVIGVTPLLARDLEHTGRAIPAELLIKAQTLGAAWLFLISAEAISATAGLGYRIFLVRRYLAMDVILPYVVWITLLAWLMDWSLRAIHRRFFPWAEGGRA